MKRNRIFRRLKFIASKTAAATTAFFGIALEAGCCPKYGMPQNSSFFYGTKPEAVSIGEKHNDSSEAATGNFQAEFNSESNEAAEPAQGAQDENSPRENAGN